MSSSSAASWKKSHLHHCK